MKKILRRFSPKGYLYRVPGWIFILIVLFFLFVFISLFYLLMGFVSIFGIQSHDLEIVIKIIIGFICFGPIVILSLLITSLVTVLFLKD